MRKYRAYIFALLVCMLVPQYASAKVYRAWFTNADIENADVENSIQLPAPNNPLAAQAGTCGDGVYLSRECGFDVPLTDFQANGVIDFWIMNSWPGNDNSSRKILRIGTPTAQNNPNGILIEKTANNVLRFLMAGKNGTASKVTAIRYDISGWQSGDWHHVEVAWKSVYDEAAGIQKPTGLAMWIDKVAVSSEIFGGTAFFDPASTDQKVYIGDVPTAAVMDELLIRDTLDSYPGGPTATAFRDYFRTGPYTQIYITNKPQNCNSDTRVIKGYIKQFGVTAKRITNAYSGAYVIERITNYDGECCWGDYDARDYITWASSNPVIASIEPTIDGEPFLKNVVKGNAVGTFTLDAVFRGMHASTTQNPYNVQVISANLPDLDLMYVERTSLTGGRYRALANPNKPTGTEMVRYRAHVGNFGYASIPSGTTVKFEFIPDVNGNFICDDAVSGTPVTKTINYSLPAGAGTTYASPITVYTDRAWSSTPTFVRVTVAPPVKTPAIVELCNANNQRCDLNTGRAVVWGFGVDTAGNRNNDYVFVADYTGVHADEPGVIRKAINLVGSFSDYDWCQSEVERLGQMIREAKYATSDPVKGIPDAVRCDAFVTVEEYFNDRDQGIHPDGSLYDGGYEELWPTRMTLRNGEIHEMGHNVLGLCDLYGHDVANSNMLVRDTTSGAPYAHTPVYPDLDTSYDIGAWQSATMGGYQDVLGLGIPPLMITNNTWLEPYSAGWVTKNAGTRRGMAYTAENHEFFIPPVNKIKFLDINDNPLNYAAVYAYQCINMGFVKYYSDRQKFFGGTGTNGTFTFPTTTSRYWDDWNTPDTTEGAVAVSTPFERWDATLGRLIGACPPSCFVGEMMLIKVVGSNGQVEFHTVPLTEFNAAYMAGCTDASHPFVYTIKTSLTSNLAAQTEKAPKTIYVGGQRPQANVAYNGAVYSSSCDVTIPVGVTTTFDGSVSTDDITPASALYYRWDSPFGRAQSSSYSVTPTEAGDFAITFYVIDGVCCSEPVTLTVHARPCGTITGQIRYTVNNLPVAGAIVGFKQSAYATADAERYVLTDANGNYTSPYLEAAEYYVAAWREGSMPTTDTRITVEGGTQTNISLMMRPQTENVALGLTDVAASNSDGGDPTLATDGDLDTFWATGGWPAEPVYYYMDLGTATNIDAITIFRYLEENPYGGPKDTYWIDVMTTGNPLDPAAWDGNPTVSTAYSAENTLHGYPVTTGYAADPIGISLTGIRGIRIGMSSLVWPPDYRIHEIRVHERAQ